MSVEPQSQRSRWHRQQRYLTLAAQQFKERSGQLRVERETFYRKLVLGPSGKLNENDASRRDYLDRLKRARLQSQHRRIIERILENPAAARAFTSPENPATFQETLKSARAKGPPGAGPRSLPPLDARLNTLCTELLKAIGISQGFPVLCKIFRLEFVYAPRGADFDTTPPPASPDKPGGQTPVSIALPGDLAEQLGKAARFCGLTRGEVVAELVRRRDPAALLSALKSLQP